MKIFKFLLTPLFCLSAITAFGKVFSSAQDAAQIVFSGCKPTEEIIYLTPIQIEKIKNLSHSEVNSAIVSRWVAHCTAGATGSNSATGSDSAVGSNTTAGFAYVDSHRVRTQPESLFVVLDQKGKVRRVQVLSYLEPQEYMPREKWYDQFKESVLNDSLKLKRSIAPATGATLTAYATTHAVRRVLAIHEVIGIKQ